MEMKRIVKDLYRMKKTQENNQTMIVYDYLHMRVKQMQKRDYFGTLTYQR